jgi:hypothetical protein
MNYGNFLIEVFNELGTVIWNNIQMSLPTMTTANYLWMVFAIVVFWSLWLYLPKLRNIHPSSNPNHLQHLDIPQILPTHQNLTITVVEIQIQ